MSEHDLEQMVIAAVALSICTFIITLIGAFYGDA